MRVFCAGAREPSLLIRSSLARAPHMRPARTHRCTQAHTRAHVHEAGCVVKRPGPPCRRRSWHEGSPVARRIRKRCRWGHIALRSGHLPATGFSGSASPTRHSTDKRALLVGSPCPGPAGCRPSRADAMRSLFDNDGGILSGIIAATVGSSPCLGPFGGTPPRPSRRDALSNPNPIIGGIIAAMVGSSPCLGPAGCRRSRAPGSGCRWREGAGGWGGGGGI